MKTIRLFGVFVVFSLATALEAQIVDARDNLILPVNPPRSIAKPNAANLEEQLPLLLSILQVSTELDEAKARGLGPDHPTVKSLQAKLAVMQNQLAAMPARTLQTSPQSLVDRLAQYEARQKEKEATLNREVALLRTEVARLQEELKKVQK